jgi:hypothetical protein
MSHFTSWSELHGGYSYDDNDENGDDDMDRVLCGQENVN